MSKMNDLHLAITELLESGQYTVFEIAVIVDVPMGIVRGVYDSLMEIEDQIYEYR